MRKGFLLFQKSKRMFKVILLIVILYSYAMFQGGFVSWFLFYSIIPFLLYSLLLNLFPVKIENVERKIEPSRLLRGGNAHITVRFQNKSLFPFIFMTVHEIGMNEKFYKKVVGRSNNIFFVGWKRTFEWSYQLENLNRGMIHFQGLQLKFTDFFGWTVKEKKILTPQHVLVYPNISTLTYKSIQMQFEQGGFATQFSSVKDTSLVTGIREYEPGDRYSWIHWKTFSKDGILKSKKFEERQSQQITLIIDRSTKKHFDDVVELGGSILQTIVKHQGDISFLSSGKERHYFPFIKTGLQLEKAYEHLAVMEPDATVSLEQVLINEINSIQHSILLLVTSDTRSSLQQFLQQHNLPKGVLCFIVADERDYESVKQSIQNSPQVKFVPIKVDMFQKAFAEVVKP